MVTSTPPRSPARLPDYVPRRSQRRRDRLRGLLAAVFVLLLVVGVPVGLALGVGFPDALSLPDKSWVTAQLDTTTVLQIFSLVVWVAWLHFVICLVAEWRAERRGAPSPSRVLLGGGSQLVARRLVASLLLVSGTATLLGSGTAHNSGTPEPRAAATAPAQAGAPMIGVTQVDAPVEAHRVPHAAAHHPAATAAAVPAHVAAAIAAAPKKYYEVEAHQGRHYDTLWGISERYLGNGLRYKEIFALNKDRLQPDGGSLTKPDLIRPGWVLRLPDDASGPGLRVVTPVPVHRARPVSHAPKVAQQAGHALSAHTVVSHQVAVAAPTITTLASIVEHAAAPATPAPQQADTVRQAQHSGGTQLPSDLLGGSLVAAGLLLGLRRRRGAFGGAEPDAVAAEGALRLAADLPSAQLLDRATRQLAADLAAAGRPVPEVYAALLDDDGLTLCFQPAEPVAPPMPWSASEDLTSWSIAAADLTVTAAADEVAAPFPGLAVFGVLDRRRVLLDLEAAPGLVSIGGDGRVARDLAASVAVELATNLWSDDVRVTLVGFGDDLAALAPHRMQQAGSLDEALAAMEERLAGLAEAAEAPDAVLRGRRQRSAAATWRPEVLVLSAPPTVDESRRIAALLGDRRLPAAVLTVGDAPQARWRFVARPDGSLDTGVLGIEMEAASLPADRYRPLMGLFGDNADHVEGVEGTGEPSGPTLVMSTLRRSPDDDGPGSAGGVVLPIAVDLPAEMLRLDRRFPVEVRLLGPVTVAAPGVLDADRVDLATELVAYVALHPQGVHPNVLQAALWPRGADQDVVDAAMQHVQGWLGRSGNGEERLRLTDGRWLLSSEVRVDWPVFRALIRAGSASLDVDGSLVRALSLVTGPFGEGLPAGRYGWLAGTGAEQAIRAAVVSAAHEASESALARGDGRAALVLARSGLLMLPTSELLWRDCLRAAASAEDRVPLQQVAHDLSTTLGGARLRELSASQTDALLGELVPGFRHQAA